MKFSVPALGLTAATSVSASSSIAIGGRLKRDADLTKKSLNPSFSQAKVESHKTAVNTKQLASKDTNQPLLSVTKTNCVDSFFPDQTISRPTSQLDFNTTIDNAFPEGNFNLSGSANPIGCRITKMSKLKNGSGFSYLSETALQNNNRGLAFYLAVTNTKNANAVNFEHWLFFFEKKNDKWSEIKSGYWTRSVSSGNQQKKFSTKSPLGTEMTWNPPTTTSTDWSGIIGGTTQNSDGLWESPDLVDSGVWFVSSEYWDNKHYFLEKGTEEREALQCIACSDEPDPIPFLKKLKVTQKGKWQSFRSLCEYRSQWSDEHMLDGEKNLCFNNKASVQ